MNAVRGFLEGGQMLSGALGNLAQTQYGIARDKENRAIAAEERAYRKEQDKLALGQKQQYLDLAIEDRKYRRTKDQQEGSMRAFQNVSNMRNKMLSIEGQLAKMESDAKAMPGVDVNKSPNYRQLKRQLGESKKMLQQYLLNDPYAKKFTSGLAMSATGNDAEANLMAKMSGLPAKFNQGNISLEDIEGNILEDIASDEAISVLKTIDGIDGLTFDKGSKSFFDTATKMRYDMGGESLKPGEKYKRFSDNVYGAFEGGRIDKADLESVGINMNSKDEVLIPKSDKSGNITGFKKETISPEAFMANQIALKEQRDKRDKMIELGIKEGKLDMRLDSKGNPIVSAAKKPMGWDNLTAGAQMRGLEATNRLINSGYVNMQEVTEIFDEDGELKESIKKTKLKNLRDLSAGEIERWQLALGKAWQTTYDKALIDGLGQEQAKMMADKRLNLMVPGENEALKQQAEDEDKPVKETKEPKKPVKAFGGYEAEFEERLAETPLDEAARELGKIPKNFLKNVKAMASEDFDAIGKDLTENKAKRAPEVLDSFEKVRVLQELTDDQQEELIFGLGREDAEFDKKVANVLRALEKSKGWLLPFKNFKQVDFQKSSPLFKRAVKDLKKYLSKAASDRKSGDRPLYDVPISSGEPNQDKVKADIKTLDDFEKMLFIDGKVTGEGE